MGQGQADFVFAGLGDDVLKRFGSESVCFIEVYLDRFAVLLGDVAATQGGQVDDGEHKAA